MNNTTAVNVSRDTELQPLRQSDDVISDASGYGTVDYSTISNTQQAPRYATLRLRSVAMSCARDELPEDEVIHALRNMDEVDGDHDGHDNSSAIRDLHYSLSVKRRILSKLNDKQTKRKKRKIGFAALINYKTHFTGVRIKRQILSFFAHLNLWENSIRSIEGRFGSSVASYFIFLRRLVALNFFISILCLGFLLVPQLIDNKHSDAGMEIQVHGSNIETDLRTTTPYFQKEIEYVVESKDKPTYWDYEIGQRDGGVESEISVKSYNPDKMPFQWHNLLTGSGALGSSLLYYGTYTNGSTSSDGNLKYNIPLAYFFTVISCFLLCLIVLTIWLGQVYKEHTLSSIGSHRNIFSSLVFSSWDFTITSGNMAQLKSESIHQEILEELSSVVKKQQPPLRLKAKFELFARKFCNHILAVGLLVASGALVWYLLQKKALENTIMVLDDVALPLTITAVLLVVPIIFSMIIKWEGYSSKYTELNMTMLRMFVLLLTVLGVMVYYWFQVSTLETKEAVTNLCWETLFGQEIYRLLIIDFIVVMVPTIPIGYLRRVLHERGFRIVGNPEFNLSTNSWYLIYNQMLCWLGLFYFPMVSSFLLLKFILTFFITMIHIKLNCYPPERAWRAGKAQKIFLLLTFTALICTFIPIIYSIISLHPSTCCGPFKSKEIASEVILDMFQSWEVNRKWLGLVVQFITRPGFIAGYLIALGVGLLQSYANNVSRAKMVAMLQDQIIMEGKDKAWLHEIVNAAKKKSQSGVRAAARAEPQSPVEQMSNAYYNIHVYEPMSQHHDDIQF